MPNKQKSVRRNVYSSSRFTGLWRWRRQRWIFPSSVSQQWHFCRPRPTTWIFTLCANVSCCFPHAFNLVSDFVAIFFFYFLFVVLCTHEMGHHKMHTFMNRAARLGHCTTNKISCDRKWNRKIDDKISSAEMKKWKMCQEISVLFSSFSWSLNF